MESLFREIPYELERALQNVSVSKSVLWAVTSVIHFHNPNVIILQMDFEKFEEFYHSLMNRYHTLGYEDFCEDVQQ